MEENGDNGHLLTGLSSFEEEIVPRLEGLSRDLAQLGKHRHVIRQAGLLHPGDIQKELQEVLALCRQAGDQAQAVGELLGRFALAPDEAGRREWEEAFLRQCRELKVAVEGEFPVYRAFPIDIRVDLAHDQVLVNRRIVRTLHPRAVAGRVAREIERLNRERFNANQFMAALVRTYDLLVAEMCQDGARKETTKQQPLKRIYDVLAMRTGTSGYSLGQFAFDLFRLRRGAELVCEGRRLVFGTTRYPGQKGIKVPGERDPLSTLEVAPVGSDYNG